MGEGRREGRIEIYNYSCLVYMELLSSEERELCRCSQVDFHAQSSYSFSHEQIFIFALYITSLSPICKLYPDFLTTVIAAAIMYRSVKSSASKENPAQNWLKHREHVPREGTLRSWVDTMSAWLRFFPSLHLANIKLVLHLVVWKLMLLLGLLLSCSCPVGERERNVALRVRKRFPKSFWKTLLMSHWPEPTRPLVHLFVSFFIHVVFFF